MRSALIGIGIGRRRMLEVSVELHQGLLKSAGQQAWQQEHDLKSRENGLKISSVLRVEQEGCALMS